MNPDACNHIPIACVNGLCSVVFVSGASVDVGKAVGRRPAYSAERKKRGCIIPIHPLFKIALYAFLF